MPPGILLGGKQVGIIPGTFYTGSRPTGTSGFVPPPPMQFGAGQGPVPATGQLADNPFQNSFNFQIPQPSSDGTGSTATGSTTSTGYGQYLPLIIVGVIVAGLGYYLFGRKK